MRTSLLLTSLFSLTLLGAANAMQPVAPLPAASSSAFELLNVTKVWDRGHHQAFTDLIRYKDQWVLAFREGEKHVGAKDAKNCIRVLTSADFEKWTEVAELVDPRGDIRDAKMTVLPDGRLTLLTCTRLFNEKGGYQSIAFFSSDAKTWTPAKDVGPHNYWLWGIETHNGAAYTIGYSTGGKEGRHIKLFKTSDGETYEPVTDKLQVGTPNPPVGDAYPNENAILFEGGKATALIRFDPVAGPGVPFSASPDLAHAWVGTASAPYTDWTWKKTDTRVGGPALTRSPDGKLLGAGRIYGPKPHTSLFEVDLDSGKLTESLILPSAGDTSYPGLVWHNGLLHVSYYSTHEGKTSIYLAKIRPAAATATH